MIQIYKFLIMTKTIIENNKIKEVISIIKIINMIYKLKIYNKAINNFIYNYY